MSILDEIVERKRADLPAWKQRVSLEQLQQQVAGMAPPPPFAGALQAAPVGLIAEAKRRSPSAGIIREPFNPPALARAYAGAGVQAMSVLIDEPYFGGGPEHLAAVRAAVDLPLLYKEFVVDPWQIWQARSLGASAVLLIAAVLNDEDLARLIGEAARAGVEVLLEVHDAEEMRRAVACGAPIIGINNRNLKHFTVSLETTFELARLAGPECTLVSESGLRSPEDIAAVKQAGAQAVLVGEQLLRGHDVGDAVRCMMERVWASS